MDVLDPAGDTAIDAKVLARRPAGLTGAIVGILKRAVWKRARVPLSAFAPENIERFSGIHPEGFRDRPLDTLAPIARDWRDIMVIVVGGAGKHSVVIPTFGMTRSVTRRIAG